jgi:hypothetical protein
MPFAAILAAIEGASTAVQGIIRFAELQRQKGEITQEQLDTIKDRAKTSDERWDAAVVEAESRIVA